MTASKDLLLSILSMDAYNRGYNPGITGLSDAPGSSVGSASILDVDLPQGAAAASFYAVAYQTADGIVISYRGRGDIPAARAANGTAPLLLAGLSLGGALAVAA
ncbi:MAG: hypothetical protein WBB85_00945 [Albidovulum sp.]|uniref:hypothetical protein n=1 Tax=Albidovulum sp. TaxID=1872424 RepID=UPI003CAE6FA3